ncbi:MAG: cytochrome c3 family protein [Planctomycetota bacterium]
MPARVPLRVVLPACAALAIAVSSVVAACGRGTQGPVGTGETARRAYEAIYRPATDRVPSELATNPGTPWGDFVGSRACRPCHETAYAGWRRSFHSRTLYDVVPATVFGDFSGERGLPTEDFAFTLRPSREGGTFAMRIGANVGSAQKPDTYGAGLPPNPTGTFPVLYAFGNRRNQPYVTKAADGRHWVLPFMWDDATRTWTYCGWRPYVTNCANCHVTGIRTTATPGAPSDLIGSTMPQRYNVAPADEGWAEGAVGCETCHGAGRHHVETVKAMGNEAYRAFLAGGGAPTIHDPRKDTRERRMQQCDTCHSFMSESPITWSPGPSGYARDPHQWRIRPGRTDALLKDTGQFFADGTDMSPCTAGWVLRDSKMGKKGVECRDCHDPHGNDHWAELKQADNALCLSCHATDASGRYATPEKVLAHTRHGADSPGSLCAECHMPRIKRFSDGIHVMSAHLPGHEFSVPTGRESEGGGPPSSCNVCHVDRDGDWTQRVLKAWRDGTTPPK